MLALTKKTDYALIALSHLAKRPGEIVSARAMAGLYRLPLSILTNILKTLVQTNVLISARGPSGGYALAKPATEITLHELIAAIEGPFQFVRCLRTDPDTGQHSCELEPSCPLRLPALRIRELFTEFLEQVTLSDIFENQGAGPTPAPCQLEGITLSCVPELA